MRPEGQPGKASERRRFQALYSATLDAIVITDDDARYIDANPAACALFGLSKQEFLRRRVPYFAPPEERDASEEAWRQFRRVGKQKGEFRLARPDGDIRLVAFSATADFVPGAHLSILRDITIGARQTRLRLRSRVTVSRSSDRTPQPSRSCYRARAAVASGPTDQRRDCTS